MNEEPNSDVAEFSSDLGIGYLGEIDGTTTLQLDLRQKHMSRANRVHGGRALLALG